MERRALSLGSLDTKTADPGIGLRELVAWMVAIPAANHAIHVLDLNSLAAFSSSLASFNLIYFIACAAIFVRIRASTAHQVADRFDTGFALAIAGLACLFALIGYRFTGGILITAVATYIVWRHGADLNMRAAAAVLLAMSIHLVWGPALFQFFALELLRADAALVGTLYGYLRPDIVWTDTSFHRPDGSAITLAAACSSFHNISIAALCCVSVIMLMRNSWQRSDLWTILAACAAMIAFNVIRICMLGWSAELHDYWHNGAGVPILALGMTAILLAISYAGAMRTGSSS